MSRYPFLSPPWVEAAQALREEYADRVPEAPVEARINVVVTEIPHGDTQTLDGHIDTTSGSSVIDRGHLENAELTITVDYGTAKAAFVQQDPAAVMQAFLAGKILVDGDASKLFALQAAGPVDVDPIAEEMAKKLEAFTDPDS